MSVTMLMVFYLLTAMADRIKQLCEQKACGDMCFPVPRNSSFKLDVECVTKCPGANIIGTECGHQPPPTLPPVTIPHTDAPAVVTDHGYTVVTTEATNTTESGHQQPPQPQSNGHIAIIAGSIIAAFIVIAFVVCIIYKGTFVKDFKDLY